MRALSPSQPTELQRGVSTSDLGQEEATPPAVDGGDGNIEEYEEVIEEEEEEAELTQDELIEDFPEVYQDNETLQLVSSDDERDCPMSPNFSRAVEKVCSTQLDEPPKESVAEPSEEVHVPEPPPTQPSPAEIEEQCQGLWAEDVKGASAFEGWGWNGHHHTETQAEQSKENDEGLEKELAELTEELEKEIKSEDEQDEKKKVSTKGTFKVG